VERSVKHQDERLENHLIPAWGNRHIIDIRRRDAIELIENIASNKPGAARNVLMAARAMFTYALRREMVEYNPFSEVGLAVPAATSNDRDRTLRRTARTGMAALRVPERHVEAVLNHSLEGVKKIYDRHHYDKEIKAALTKWSKHLEKLIIEMPTQQQHPES
jgi:hypothetical protein